MVIALNVGDVINTKLVRLTGHGKGPPIQGSSSRDVTYDGLLEVRGETGSSDPLKPMKELSVSSGRDGPTWKSRPLMISVSSITKGIFSADSRAATSPQIKVLWRPDRAKSSSTINQTGRSLK